MSKLLSLIAAAAEVMAPTPPELSVYKYSRPLEFDSYGFYVSKQGGIPYYPLSTGKCRKKKSNGIHRSRMLKRKHRKS